MTAKLDSVDIFIIQELNRDGRVLATEIATKLNDVSERVVQYRIEKLIQEEVIRVVAILDLEPLGFTTRADILIDVEPGLIHAISHQLAKYDEISYVACHFGAHDISITVHAKNNKEHFAPIYGGKMWYVLNVVQCWSKLIPVYLSSTTRDW